jgi:tripartite-type tricarboxylate transporter receptor subunit TctC
MAISPALHRHLDFDITRDFTGVTLIASQPSMLVVHPSVSASNVQGLLALAKASPGKLPYASAGVGSATHLGTELLMHATGTQMLHVPYKSAGLATTALLAGEAQVLLTNMASVLPHVSAGRLKALGISSAERSPLAPQVPTIRESGVPGFEYSTWYGMLMPARTPEHIVHYVQKSAADVLKTSTVAERFTGRGLQTYASSPTEFDRYLKGEVDKWARLVTAARIAVD